MTTNVSGMEADTSYETPITFRPGKSIRKRLVKVSTTSGTGQSKLINAALDDFFGRHKSPEAVIEAVKNYHLAQVKAKA